MKNLLIICSVLLLATGACKKEVMPDAPAFALKATAITFKAGVEGAFTFEGNPGIISFYSGEAGHVYKGDGINKSVAVKGNSEARLEKFTYTYAEKGTYKAYFIAQNTNIYGSREVVRQIDVTVTD